MSRSHSKNSTMIRGVIHAATCSLCIIWMIKYALRGSVICRLRSPYCCYSHTDEVKALILWDPNSRRGMSTNGATCVNAIHSPRVCQLQINLLSFYEKIYANLSEQISWFIYNCRIAKILKYTCKIINKCMIELLCYLIMCQFTISIRKWSTNYI